MYDQKRFCFPGFSSFSGSPNSIMLSTYYQYAFPCIRWAVALASLYFLMSLGVCDAFLLNEYRGKHIGNMWTT
jgi:hypothetical protein